METERKGQREVKEEKKTRRLKKEREPEALITQEESTLSHED